ncbi:MAG TPA: asparagine--tRNA ligase [Saprospiraceae bacterium]|nr:asparagine--tRNA ligase [Saprospiraceae bacterium]HQW56469.1 asparagine--tRNA ligase [Saprospiraceae bacterium]
MHQYINELANYAGQQATLKGWVSGIRSGKGLFFIVMRDGTGFCQVVVSADSVSEAGFEAASKLTQESSFEVTGTIVQDEKQIGGYEMQATDLQIIHLSEEYPISNKEHGVTFLSNNRHLWLRSRRQWAIMRVRNEIIMGIHDFFQSRGFIQMDSPLFTGNAVEGTTTLFETDFFGQPAYLSQSGQLYGEAMAMAQGKIYTFGPTFRAEKSDTPRHLSEFWMIEPEMAFYDLEMDMQLIEEFIKSLIGRMLDRCKIELEVLNRDVSRLENVFQPFPRVTHADAAKILRGELEVNGKNAIRVQEADLEEARQQLVDLQSEIAEREEKIKTASKGEKRFHEGRILQLRKDIEFNTEKVRNIPQWIESARHFSDENDFGNSDETVLTRVFDAPVMVYNWPAPIKSFYMKEVDGDPSLVKGVDLLAPDGYGEIIGGSERETDINILLRKIAEHKLPQESFEWYLDLRRFGSVPHAGFGLGLERMVRWVCGLDHMRETIPFPRRYGRLFP